MNYSLLFLPELEEDAVKQDVGHNGTKRALTMDKSKWNIKY